MKSKQEVKEPSVTVTQVGRSDTYGALAAERTNSLHVGTLTEREKVGSKVICMICRPLQFSGFNNQTHTLVIDTNLNLNLRKGCRPLVADWLYSLFTQ